MDESRAMELCEMGDAIATHLSDASREVLFDALAKHPARFVALLNAYDGEERTPQEFARLCLRLAKRVLSEGGQAS